VRQLIRWSFLGLLWVFVYLTMLLLGWVGAFVFRGETEAGGLTILAIASTPMCLAVSAAVALVLNTKFKTENVFLIAAVVLGLLLAAFQLVVPADAP
jgi:hypothetical protein